MNIPQHVSQRRLAQILGVTTRAVRKRGGTSLPVPVKGQYNVADVLWHVGVNERREIVGALGINLEYLHLMFICSIHPSKEEM